jgi:hypothetical protein
MTSNTVSDEMYFYSVLNSVLEVCDEEGYYSFFDELYKNSNHAHKVEMLNAFSLMLKEYNEGKR